MSDLSKMPEGAKRVDWQAQAVSAAVRYERLRSDCNALLVTLREVEEFLDDCADAEIDQYGLLPNAEMRMLQTVRAALAKFDGRTV